MCSLFNLRDVVVVAALSAPQLGFVPASTVDVPFDAELSPGSSDSGFTIYQIRGTKQGEASNNNHGMVVVIGDNDVTGGWSKKTAYWYWVDKEKISVGTDVCDRDPVTAFPPNGFTLEPMFIQGNTGSDANWGPDSSNEIQGCTPTTAGVAPQGLKPMDNYTSFNWSNQDNTYWKVREDNSSGTVLGYLKAAGAPTRTSWAYTHQINCSSPPSTLPLFSADLNGILYFEGIQPPGSHSCAAKATDPAQPPPE